MVKMPLGLRRETVLMFSMFSFPEQLVSVEVADVFKSGFNEFLGFLDYGCCCCCCRWDSLAYFAALQVAF
jgi:hypothetical protein